MPSQAERLAWLADQLPQLAGSGIVYTLTVRDAEQVAAWLKSQGINAEAYTSETGKGREELEQALLENRVKALVATTALGMGYDKPDLAFVIHYQTPGSVVAYYQQVGRAGRALDAAYGVLLSGYEETDITDYFIRTAFPSRADVQQVVAVLESEPDGLSVRQIQARANISFGRIDKAEAFWERAERLTALRRVEQAQMQEYVGLQSGHMEFLIRALDGDPEGLSAPDLPDLPTSPAPERIREAVAFLRRSHRPIEPRKAWPTGKRIDKDELAQPGMALSVWGDAGWGEDVRRGKYRDGRFSDALVEASAAAVREWQPEPSPAWVTAVPSRRHAGVVPDFARRLALALGLPYVDTLAKKQDRPEQKEMQNSDQQARNVIGSLAVNQSAMLPAPVLLVDDMVDSRWTFTVAARLLRLSGSGVVWPFALADTAGTR